MPDSRYRVTVLTSTNQEHNLTLRLRVLLMMPYLQAHGFDVEIVHLQKSRKARIQQLAQLPKADIVWVHRHIFARKELDQLLAKGQTLVYDHDDPVAYSSSNFANLAPKRWLRYKRTVRASAAVIAASPGLVKLAGGDRPNIYHIPLCAEPEIYSQRVQPRAEAESFKLLWLGGRSTFKYLQQSAAQLEAVGQQLDNVELIVVGHDELHLEQLKVSNLQWSPEVEQQQLQRCHLGLVPSSDDRWTRAKATLKPLQYLASGMPILASPVGVAVNFTDNGKNGLLARSAEEWVAAVEKLQQDETLRQTMGANGIRYVNEHHSAAVLAPQVAAVFKSLVDPQTAASD